MTAALRARRRRTGQAALHALLALGGVYLLAPFVYMVLTSFEGAGGAFDGNLWPREWTLAHFRQSWDEVPWLRYYRNGIVVTTLIFTVQVLVCVPAAYALARLRFRGSQLGLLVVLVTLLVPFQATAIPVFVLLNELSLVDRLPALVLPFIGSAFGVFLFRQYLLSLPRSVFDAARVDGVGELQMLPRVVLPVIRPAVLSFAVFSFTIHWNDFFWPILVLRTTTNATVPFGVVTYANDEVGSEYGPQMASAVLATVPMLVAFLAFQRQFVRGVRLSGGLQE